MTETGNLDIITNEAARREIERLTAQVAELGKTLTEMKKTTNEMKREIIERLTEYKDLAELREDVYELDPYFNGEKNAYAEALQIVTEGFERETVSPKGAKLEEQRHGRKRNPENIKNTRSVDPVNP